MRIVLDSSIIVGDFHLTNPLWGAIFYSIDQKECQLFTPRIVIDEVTSKYRETLSNTIDDIEDKIEKANQKGCVLQIDIPTKDDVHDQVAKYSDWLSQTLAHYSESIMEYPATPHDKVVHRALIRKAPFDSNGRVGYRDYLIWLNVLSLIDGDRSHIIALLTSNTKDFANKNGALHDDLRDDLAQAGVQRDHVRVYTDIKSFVDNYLISKLPARYDIINMLAHESRSGINLSAIISESLPHVLTRVLDPRDLGLDSPLHSPTLLKVQETKSVEIKDARNMEKSQVLLDIFVRALSVVRVLVPNRMLEAVYSTYGLYIVDESWSGWDALLEIPCWLDFSISATSDEAKHEIVAIAVSRVKESVR